MRVFFFGRIYLYEEIKKLLEYTNTYMIKFDDFFASPARFFCMYVSKISLFARFKVMLRLLDKN